MLRRPVGGFALGTLVLMLVAATGSGGASATAPQAPDTQGSAGVQNEEPVALEASVVEVPVVVTDRKRHFVSDLAAEDFALHEDGTRQDVSLVSTSRAPLRIAIVIDTSSSTADTLGRIQASAVAFVQKLTADDLAMVVSFADSVELRQELTSDRTLLEKAIRRGASKGGTRLYEAVSRTASEWLGRIDGRKVMIVVSDGGDTAGSTSDAERAIRACAENDVAVYGIRFPPSATGGRASSPTGLVNRFMERLAASTGGLVLSTGEPAFVPRMFAALSAEFAHTYLLTYTPGRPLSLGGYRRIEVTVPRSPELLLRHRTGYFAAPKPESR